MFVCIYSLALSSPLYYNTAAAVDLNSKLSEDIPTNKDVRQGRPVSPTLFNIYVDDILSLIHI